MIPNCPSCEAELDAAFEYQSLGADIALEGMAERKHCFFFFVEDEEGTT